MACERGSQLLLVAASGGCSAACVRSDHLRLVGQEGSDQAAELERGCVAQSEPESFELRELAPTGEKIDLDCQLA